MAIEREMKNVWLAFTLLEEGTPEPVCSKRIPCHMVFDMKLDFTWKAHFAAGGHVTDPPTSLTVSSVVACDSIRLAFMIAALNDVDILSADIGNAYLNAPTKEKVHMICHVRFGHNIIGRIAVISRALYGLKSSGAAWCSTLASTLYESGFKLTHVDPDVLMRPATKEDGSEYYEYIFVYVDDILAISEKQSIIIKGIGDVYRLKEGIVMRPSSYLGATIKQHKLPDSPIKIVWSMSADKYVKEVV